MADADLNLLVALDALLAEASVAGAARRLGLSASAMSRTLARLRAATGDALLVRAGRALVPTPHALVLRHRAGALAQEARAMLRPADTGLDLARLSRLFTLRASDGFVEAFGGPLAQAVREAAPGVQLRFAPKPDKTVAPLRDGLVDLDIGVLGETGPEMRVQKLFDDHFVGVARIGHPVLHGGMTAARYAACAHVGASRRGVLRGPVDEALAELGLTRHIAMLVPGFPAAVSVAASSDLLAAVTASFLRWVWRGDVARFALPVPTPGITVSQMWHPRLDADAGHRWLRGMVRQVASSGQGAPG